MIARFRKSIDEKDKGFTLIELLVVMIIIGILAAIAIPVFLNQQKKARDTSTKADISTVGKEIATYYVDGKGKLTITVAAGEATVKDDATTNQYTATIKLSTGTTGDTQTITYADPPAWCVALTNPNGVEKTYHYGAVDGLQPGGCPTA